jgi:SAM-dependent methyltransferase
MFYEFIQSKIDLKKGSIIDIGSGDGSDAKVFEAKGFSVFCIDKKDGIDAVTFKYPKNKFNYAIAKNSLPFMGKHQLEIISKIYLCLKKGGIFYGTIFGKDDPWSEKGIITPLSFRTVEKHLKKSGFEILWRAEEKGIGRTMKGELKNWHIFKFLVRK